MSCRIKFFPVHDRKFVRFEPRDDPVQQRPCELGRQIAIVPVPLANGNNTGVIPVNAVDFMNDDPRACIVESKGFLDGSRNFKRVSGISRRAVGDGSQSDGATSADIVSGCKDNGARAILGTIDAPAPCFVAPEIIVTDDQPGDRLRLLQWLSSAMRRVRNRDGSNQYLRWPQSYRRAALQHNKPAAYHVPSSVHIHQCRAKPERDGCVWL
jgi:hypothetical protein